MSVSTLKMLKLVVLCIFVSFDLALSKVPGDKIDNLPGISFKINFDQYSGYLTTDNVTFIHYWLVESQHDPDNDPIVLWLNGGPACSSLFGLLTENGPFRVTDIDHSITENVYAWNKIANVVYFESPAWVGFSYSYDQNIVYNDDNTADLNYRTLLEFFKNYPEYNNRSLYITGESYGGVYLPMLADRIINDTNLLPRFKGVVVGNGDFSNPALADSVVPLMYSHNLVGEQLWRQLGDQCCNGNAMNCNYYNITQHRDWSHCYNWTILISNMPTVARLDPYNLYDTCYIDTAIQSSMRTAQYRRYLQDQGLDLDTLHKIARDNGIEPATPTSSVTTYPDCFYNGYVMYLQRPDVRNALHVPGFVPQYEDCNRTILYKLYKKQYVDQISHLIPIFNAKVPLLCYNGDVDTVCNALGDQRFVSTLNRTQKGPTVPWTYAEDTYKTSGWQTLYDGVDFLTVRGSGHYVPHDKPREALQMITNFIRKKPYSDSTGIDVTPQPLLDSSSGGSKIVSESTTCLLFVLVIYFIRSVFIFV